MICLPCAAGRQEFICRLCGECSHLCKGRCFGTRRMKSIADLELEKSRIYPKAPVSTQRQKNLGFSKCLNKP